MFKGFKEFLSRGNIVDLATAVVIGTAFTALVTKFTDSIITPLINRIGVTPNSDVGVLRIDIGGGQTIDLNIVLSAAINFVLIASVVYFLVVLPYNTLRRRGEVEQADDAQIVLLTEIRDLLRGQAWASLAEADQAMIDLDGTANKDRLGANATVGTSMALARALATSAGVPLWQWLTPDGVTPSLPVPHFNVLNGGVHAPNRLDFQEFMVAPVGAPSMAEAVRAGAEVYGALRRELGGTEHAERFVAARAVHGDVVGAAQQFVQFHLDGTARCDLLRGEVGVVGEHGVVEPKFGSWL